jgi:hypothetical protein
LNNVAWTIIYPHEKEHIWIRISYFIQKMNLK